MRLTARRLLMGAQLSALSIVLVISEIALSQTPNPSQKGSKEPEIGVRAMIFSADGNTLAIVRGDLRPQRYVLNNGYDSHVNFLTHQSEIELWSVAENKLSRKLSEFAGPIFLTAFSPDGNSLATVSWEVLASKPVEKQIDNYKATGVLKLWDTRTGELKWSRNAHTRGVSALTFYPDSKLLISAGGSSLSYELKVWDSQSGEQIRTIEYRARIGALAVSADGHALAVTKAIFFEPRSEIKVYDARTFKEQMTLKSTTKSPFGEHFAPCAFSPDGTILAVARSGIDQHDHFTEVELWNVQTRKPASVLTFHKSPVLQEELKSLNQPWGPYRQLMVDSLRARSLPVTSLVFSRQGSRLTAANWVQVIVWNAPTGEIILNGVSWTAATATALTPGGDTLAIADRDNQVSLWNVNTGALRNVLALSDVRETIDVSRFVVSIEKIRSVAFYPGGKTIACAGAGPLVRLWDAQSGIEKLALRGLESEVLSVAVSSDATTLVGGCEDGTIKIWGAQTGNLEHTVSANGARVNSVAVSPDGSLVAGGSEDSSVAVWDARTGEPKLTLKGHAGPVTGVAFSPDGTLIASAGVDRLVRLWDVKSGDEVRALKSSLAPITAIAFSSSGTLATGTTDGSVNVWEARTGQLVETLRGHQGQVNSVAFSPDGEIVASGGDDKTVRLWDTRTGKSKRKLEGHGAAVYCLAFSPDGKTLVAGTGNNMLVFWDPQSGALKRVIRTSRSIPVHKG